MAHEKFTKTEKKEINALLVDDHYMVREGLKKMLLALKPKLQIKVTEADSGIAALKKLEKRDFDIVFMDYQMPGMSGLETIYRMLRFKAHLKIITLSNYDDLSFVESVRDAGSKGYLLKNVESSELLKAINSVIAGGVCYSSEISIKLLDAAETTQIEKKINTIKLTPREMEILQLVALALTDKEIGERLCIAHRTVGTHRHNIMSKLGVKKSIGLLKEALRLRLVE